MSVNDLGFSSKLGEQLLFLVNLIDESVGTALL